MTTLENQFLDAMFTEAYGGTLFTADIQPSGMASNQKSGVVSSLVQKNLITVDEEYGQIGIVVKDDEPIYEISREDVMVLRERAQ